MLACGEQTVVPFDARRVWPVGSAQLGDAVVVGGGVLAVGAVGDVVPLEVEPPHARSVALGR